MPGLPVRLSAARSRAFGQAADQRVFPRTSTHHKNVQTVRSHPSLHYLRYPLPCAFSSSYSLCIIKLAHFPRARSAPHLGYGTLMCCSRLGPRNKRYGNMNVVDDGIQVVNGFLSRSWILVAPEIPSSSPASPRIRARLPRRPPGLTAAHRGLAAVNDRRCRF